VVTSAKVSAFTGYGILGLIHMLLSTPLCHLTTIVSNVPAGTVTFASPLGEIASPPIAAILPQ
jgi:hypothetical protein